MFRPRVIPVLLLKGFGLVKTVKFKNERYIGDPINAVRIFNDLEADELVFLDITATNENRTIDVELVKKIGDEAYMPFAVGGGIKTVNQALHLIAAGAEKVIINSAFYEKPTLVSELAAEAGSQSVVVSLDIRKKWIEGYCLYSKSGTKKSELKLYDALKKAEQLGAGEILINCIDRDGTMTGYDLKLIKIVCESVNIPVIACGGVGSYTHLREAYEHGAHALAAGSLFIYHGQRNAVLINYPTKKELKQIFYD